MDPDVRDRDEAENHRRIPLTQVTRTLAGSVCNIHTALEARENNYHEFALNRFEITLVQHLHDHESRSVKRLG